MFQITPNDGAIIVKTLYKDGQTFTIPVAATVRAAIISDDHTRLLAGPVTVSPADPGADWSASHLVIRFAAADLSSLTSNAYIKLEIEVDDGGEKLTWFDEGRVVVGHIA